MGNRDNTLTYSNPEKIKWRNEIIESWSGKKFQIDYNRTMKLFHIANYRNDGFKTIEEEIEFWRRYYYQLLKSEGITEKLEIRANILFDELWCNNDRLLFNEVIEVLDYFKNNGYKMGVISDTSPSLQLTLEQLGLGKYFDCYICSDIVGVQKPNPIIYNAALKALRVKAEESIYVDDYYIEADGARNLGFTSFHINRNSKRKGKWEIASLKELIEYVEINN
ncbi:HAD family hydrolase [uncultured Clostridium sp.]|uniref:HAD family hydrolase n=1 Tax=uncultured Clostridium sp. TaxID=59620 RepID=UPI0033902001